MTVEEAADLPDIWYCSRCAPSDPERQNHCFCEEEKDDPLVSCDHPSCSIVYFHEDCANADAEAHPNDSGDWYCPECRQKHGV